MCTKNNFILKCLTYACKIIIIRVNTRTRIHASCAGDHFRLKNSYKQVRSKTHFIDVIVHLFDYLAAAAAAAASVGLHPTKTLVSCTHKEHTVYYVYGTIVRWPRDPGRRGMREGLRRGGAKGLWTATTRRAAATFHAHGTS